MSFTSVSGPTKHNDVTDRAVVQLLSSGPKTDEEILDHFDVKGRNWDGVRGGKVWNVISTMMKRGRIERISLYVKEDKGKIRLPEPPLKN